MAAGGGGGASAVALLLANLLPVAGVLFLDWDVFSLLFNEPLLGLLVLVGLKIAMDFALHRREHRRLAVGPL